MRTTTQRYNHCSSQIYNGLIKSISTAWKLGILLVTNVILHLAILGAFVQNSECIIKPKVFSCLLYYNCTMSGLCQVEYIGVVLALSVHIWNLHTSILSCALNENSLKQYNNQEVQGLRQIGVKKKKSPPESPHADWKWHDFSCFQYQQTHTYACTLMQSNATADGGKSSLVVL